MSKQPSLACLALLTLAVSQTARAADIKIDFGKNIQPILQQSCVKCHGAEKQKGKLRLDSKASAMKGGSEGPVIVPGDAQKSDLYRRITLPKGHDDIMPNEGDPLSKMQTDLIRDWINQGATWPDDAMIASGDAATKKKNEPVLPADFKPSSAEQAAIKKLSQTGIEIRPIALNVPWREANLRLAGSNVTDATVAAIKDIRSLVDLNLAQTKITDAGLAHLKNLTYLERLHLEMTGVTDAGLVHLKGLTNLMYLNLYGSRVTDAGLEHLKNMRYLKNVYVWQTKVTDAGTAELKKALPDVQIIGGWDASVIVKKEEKPEEKEKKE